MSLSPNTSVNLDPVDIILEYAELNKHKWFTRTDIRKECGLSNTQTYNGLKWLISVSQLTRKNINNKTFAYRFNDIKF